MYPVDTAQHGKYISVFCISMQQTLTRCDVSYGHDSAAFRAKNGQNLRPASLSVLRLQVKRQYQNAVLLSLICRAYDMWPILQTNAHTGGGPGRNM